MHLFWHEVYVCENSNKIGPVAFAITLCPHNNNNIHTDRNIQTAFLVPGDFKTDISTGNLILHYFQTTILSEQLRQVYMRK